MIKFQLISPIPYLRMEAKLVFSCTWRCILCYCWLSKWMSI